MANPCDVPALTAAYNDVRNDGSATEWAVFGYDGKNIVHTQSGSAYDQFLAHCTHDDRLYGYVRVVVDGNNKYAFITWIGPGVPPLKKAKVSTDKAFVKDICPQFGKEFLADAIQEITMAKLEQTLRAAAGAAYGTGK